VKVQYLIIRLFILVHVGSDNLDEFKS